MAMGRGRGRQVQGSQAVHEVRPGHLGPLIYEHRGLQQSGPLFVAFLIYSHVVPKEFPVHHLGLGNRGGVRG